MTPACFSTFYQITVDPCSSLIYHMLFLLNTIMSIALFYQTWLSQWKPSLFAKAKIQFKSHGDHLTYPLPPPIPYPTNVWSVFVLVWVGHFLTGVHNEYNNRYFHHVVNNADNFVLNQELCKLVRCSLR